MSANVNPHASQVLSISTALWTIGAFVHAQLRPDSVSHERGRAAGMMPSDTKDTRSGSVKKRTEQHAVRATRLYGQDGGYRPRRCCPRLSDTQRVDECAERGWM